MAYWSNFQIGKRIVARWFISSDAFSSLFFLLRRSSPFKVGCSWVELSPASACCHQKKQKTKRCFHERSNKMKKETRVFFFNQPTVSNSFFCVLPNDCCCWFMNNIHFLWWTKNVHRCFPRNRIVVFYLNNPILNRKSYFELNMLYLNHVFVFLAIFSNCFVDASELGLTVGSSAATKLASHCMNYFLRQPQAVKIKCESGVEPWFASIAHIDSRTRISFDNFTVGFEKSLIDLTLNDVMLKSTSIINLLPLPFFIGEDTAHVTAHVCFLKKEKSF